MSQYFVITGQLMFTTALHIGSGKAGETTDAPPEAAALLRG